MISVESHEIRVIQGRGLQGGDSHIIGRGRDKVLSYGCCNGCKFGGDETRGGREVTGREVTGWCYAIVLVELRLFHFVIYLR